MVFHDKEKGYWGYEYTERKTRKHVKKVGFRTREEAEYAEKKRKEETGLYGEKRVPVKMIHDVIEEKLVDIKLHNPISTYDTFSSLYRLHIKDMLPNKAIKDYQRVDITNYLEKLVNSGRSNNTANKVKSFLVNVFNFALLNRYITFNPINRYPNLDHEPREVTIWTYEQFIKAVECETDYTFKMFLKFLFYCGIRKGERIITWKDIDFEKGVVSINKHYYETGSGKENHIVLKGRKNKYKDPKRRNKPLIITLNKSLIKDLKEYKEYCKKFDGFNENFYVFGGIKTIPRTTIDNKLKRLCKKAGVPVIHPHSLRHSMASLGYNNNFESQLIAARLGDTVEQVHQTYGHLREDADKPLADMMDKLDGETEDEDDED